MPASLVGESCVLTEIGRPLDASPAGVKIIADQLYFLVSTLVAGEPGREHHPVTVAISRNCAVPAIGLVRPARLRR